MERVLQRPRRVIGKEVQGVKVEILGLNLGAFRDFPAHAHKNIGDLLAQRSNGMKRAGAFTRRGNRDVDTL